ncbi:hypothetical protein [Williamsia maris]|uniref:DNA-binding protein n=1 Tax=Williamsia maris TaxID=72806 RepID=A0ABT1HK33_9NOCA|nr:hypothetical protein [Williamsia maris]MCP2178291.1 hypothetical protein [Williamsia maris]
MFVMTVDQRDSRHDVDRVGAVLDMLADAITVRPFERTAGDEIQGVLDEPAEVTRLIVELVRTGHWSVGVGTGPVDSPLPRTTRAGRGPAFEFAREAVDGAKRSRVPVAVRGPDGDPCHHAQTAARLLGDLVLGRSEPGADAVDAMRAASSQSEAAATLGITPQAMSQRLRSARWDIDADTRALVTEMLRRTQTPGQEPTG